MSPSAPSTAGQSAAPRPLPATPVSASTPGSAVPATTVQDQQAATVPGDTAPTVETTTAKVTLPTVTEPGEFTVPAMAGAGTPVTTTTPVLASTATLTKPATTTQLGTPTAFPAGSNPAAGSVGSAVTALIVVVALILALAWLAKRMPVLGGGARHNPALRIVGSLALGPRERVVVVEVGNTQLLIGVGVGGTRTLHTLAEPLAAPAPATPAFAQMLAQHFGKNA